MEFLWRRALEILKEEISSREYELWIDPIQWMGGEASCARLALPNKFYETWIREQYLDRLGAAWVRAGGESVKFDFIIAKEEEKPSGGGDSSLEPRKAAKILQLPVAPMPGLGGRIHTRSTPSHAPKEAPAERLTFENFVVGPSNRFAFAATQGACANLGGTYNPLFIYGGVGLGKTHLLRAMAEYCRQHYPHLQVVYMTSEEFTNQLISYVKQKRMDEFREIYRRCDVLLLDDIQFIAGKERTQEEIFHTFNTLYDLKKQIGIASDQIPRDIPDLEDRLRSRFDWGLLADIQPPEIETKVAIIENKADQLKIEIPNDVSFFMASIPGPSIRQIQGLLIRLSMTASLDKVPITLELARKVLKQVQWINDRPVTAEEIIKRVANYFNVRINDIKSSQRKKTLTLPRHVAMYLCRHLTSLSYPEIGLAFGGKDHATVMHAERKIKKEKEKDPQMEAALVHLIDILQG